MMKGTCIFTCKDYLKARREIFPSLSVPAAKKLQRRRMSTKKFLGFGVAITPSSCYELSLMEQGERRALLEKVYGSELGLRVGRLCIGSSDYSPEIYSYDDVADDRELKHFSVARDEKYVIPMIKEILAVKPDLYLFASPWSPPYWMKTGGSMCGGFMREEFVECYADYIVKFVRAYAEHGIKISAITPQNETNTQQAGRMPACIWHPETEARFIGVLKEKFAQNDLDIEIWMYDHDFKDVDRVLWSLENCQGLKDACDGVAFHYYHGAMEESLRISREYPKMPIHFTEGGPRLNDHYDCDWCKWGSIVSTALRLGYLSFTGWNLMLDELGGPNVGPFLRLCGGLVTRNSQTGELSFSGQYKAFSHFAPYITPTSEIFPIDEGDFFGYEVGKYPKHEEEIHGFCIDNHDGKLIAVIINPNAAGAQTQLELGGALWYLELQDNSISTVIIED